MLVKELGQDKAFFEEFTANAGDIIEIRWQGGRPQHRTILLKANFDNENFGGPGPKPSDANSGRWQVPTDGVWVALVIAPQTEGFSAEATFLSGTPVKMYTADTVSFGNLSREQAESMVNRVFELANQRRMDVASREPLPDGVSPDAEPATQRLTLDPQLSLAAQSHCINMAELDFTGHTGKDKSEAATRIAVAGFKATRTGEILAYGQGTAEGAIEAWMTSHDGHRWNLLNPGWTHTGIGVYYKADDTGEAPYRYYWAMVFANPQ